MPCPRCGTETKDKQRFCGDCGLPLEAEFEQAAMASIGQVLSDRYKLRYLIGMGGMGAVFRAEVVGLGHSVAVKILHPMLSADALCRQRLENEAKLASQIDHPSIVSILDFHSSPGLSYLVMEYLAGQSLADVMSAVGYLGVKRTIHIVRQILSALEAAHALKVLHRDLKPENIFLTARADELDYVKILDFGMATISGPTAARITTQGQICGTPAYMSPEQAQGHELDHRSDLYAAGIVLYECLTGVNPFLGKTAADTLLKQLTITPKFPSKVRKAAKIPPYLDALVMRALRKRAGDRFTSAAEFKRVLEGLVLAQRPANDSSQNVSLSTCGECGSAVQSGALKCGSCGTAMASPAIAREQISDLLSPELMVALEQTTGETDELAPTSTVTACPIIGWDPPQVGLAQEQARIDALVKKGKNFFLRVLGPHGTGKGRLARDLSRRLDKKGNWQLVWCGADMLPVLSSLQPIKTATARLLRLGESWTNQKELLARARKAGLAEEHHQGLLELFGLASALAEPADERRARRAMAWRAVVQLAARRGPLLLVFHDLDGMDAPSRELIAALASVKFPPPHLVYLVITQDPRLMLLWPETETLIVQPLNAKEVRRLAKELLNSIGIDGDSGELAATSRGNPLMLIELARLRAVDPQGPLPISLAEVINLRIGLLPPAARMLLHALAVIGRATSPTTLRALASGPASDAAALSLLAEQGFLTITSGGWRFSHRVHRDVAYASTPVAVRARLHAEAARMAIANDEPPARIAYHLFEGDDRRTAAPYLIRAGWDALRVLDDALALQQFNKVLQIVPAPPRRLEEGDDSWVTAVIGQSTALFDGGDQSSAYESIRGAIRSAEKAGWTETTERLREQLARLKQRAG